MTHETKKWSDEDELEFQMGDMHGIAFTQESEDPREYTKKEEKPYCDKKDHLERSKANDTRKKGHKKIK